MAAGVRGVHGRGDAGEAIWQPDVALQPSREQHAPTPAGSPVEARRQRGPDDLDLFSAARRTGIHFSGTQTDARRSRFRPAIAFLSRSSHFSGVVVIVVVSLSVEFVLCVLVTSDLVSVINCNRLYGPYYYLCRVCGLADVRLASSRSDLFEIIFIDFRELLV